MEPSSEPTAFPSSEPSISAQPSIQVDKTCVSNLVLYGCDFDSQDDTPQKVAVCLEKNDGGEISFQNKCEDIEVAADYIKDYVVRVDDKGKIYTLASCGCCDRDLLTEQYDPFVLKDNEVRISKEGDSFCEEAGERFPSSEPSRFPSMEPSFSTSPSQSGMPTVSNCFDSADDFGCEWDKDGNVIAASICVKKDKDGKGEEFSFEYMCEEVEYLELLQLDGIYYEKKKDIFTLEQCGCCDVDQLEAEYTDTSVLKDGEVTIKDGDQCISDPTKKATKAPKRRRIRKNFAK